MWVMCISTGAPKTHSAPQAPFVVKFLERYEVVSEIDKTREGWGKYYELSIQPGVAYAADLFVEIGDYTSFFEESGEVTQEQFDKLSNYTKNKKFI